MWLIKATPNLAASVCMFMYLCVYMCMHSGMHGHTCAHAYVCVCVLYVYTLYVYGCIFVCICIYIVSDYFEIGTVAQVPGVSAVVAFFIGITFNIGFC